MNKLSLMNCIRTAVLAAFAAIPALASCTVSVSVIPTIPAGGGVVPITVNTQAGCYWRVTTNANWLTLYQYYQGKGAATAYLYASPNNVAYTRGAWVTVTGVGTAPGPSCEFSRGGCPNASGPVFATIASQYHY